MVNQISNKLLLLALAYGVDSSKPRAHMLGFGSIHTKKAANNRKSAAKKDQRRERPKITDVGDLPAVFGVRELAAYLGVGKNTAYDLVNSGKIQAVRVGRQYRIRKEVVLEYLEGKK